MSLSDPLPRETYPAYTPGVFSTPPRRTKPLDREAEMTRGNDKARDIAAELHNAMRKYAIRGEQTFQNKYDVSGVSIEYDWRLDPDRYVPSSCSMYLQLCETDIGHDTDANDVLNCMILAATKLVGDLRELKAQLKK